MHFYPDEALNEQQILERYQAARLSGHPDIALGWLRLLIAANPGDARLAFLMGRTLVSAGRYDEAEAWLQHGLTYHVGRQPPATAEIRTPLCIIGMPRSASSNLTKTLATFTHRPTMELGFGELAPRIDVPLQDAYLKAFIEGRFACHSHLSPTKDSLERLAASGVDKIFVQIRDPRQALASFHGYSLKSAEILSRLNHVYAGYSFLPAKEQVTLLARIYYPSLLTWLKGWEDAQKERRAGLEIFIGRYEDMVAHAPRYRSTLADFLAVPMENVPPIQEDGRRTPPKEEWRRLLAPQEQQVLDDTLNGIRSELYSA